jgi:hypothetical protein
MSRAVQAIVLALLLTAAVVFGAYAQRLLFLAPLTPLLVDIQQTVPVTLTFTVDDQLVTVPAAVDVALSVQIRADGSVSPTLRVGETDAPAVTVAPLDPTATPAAESPAAQVDPNGVPYSVEISEGLVLEQINSPGYLGRFSVAGVIRNHTGQDLEAFEVRLSVATYDQDGQLIAITPGFLQVESLRDRGSGSFIIMTMEHATDVARYAIQVSGP